MAALSVLICTKRAKIIFARQFVQMTRRELEEHVVQFSRNIDSCQEITHFESEKVRYLFIPIDSFFLILITSKNSNIIEDTEVLKLVYRLIQDICGAIDYDSIINKAFEIMLGVDDIVCLGYRSGANISQVRQFMQMESLEEKEFKRKKIEQEKRVQREMMEKSKEFDKMRKEKKFLADAVSSTTFNNYGQDESRSFSNTSNSTQYNPVYSNSVREEESVNDKTNIDLLNNGEKKASKGLKLTKKKILHNNY